MKNVFGCLAIGLLAMTLSGCAGNFGITEKFSETNLLIKQANDDRLKGYGAAMAACKDNAACQVGVSMAFAGNMGQMQFFKPETVKDYLQAFMPYATLGVDVFRLWRAPGGDSQGMVVTGDGNNFIDVGNRTVADRGSTLTYNVPSYLSTNTTTQNKTTDSQPINQTGTAPAQVVEPAIVMPEVVFAPAPVAVE